MVVELLTHLASRESVMAPLVGVRSVAKGDTEPLPFEHRVSLGRFFLTPAAFVPGPRPKVPFGEFCASDSVRKEVYFGKLTSKFTS